MVTPPVTAGAGGAAAPPGAPPPSAGERTVVPVDALLEADSPRLNGEDAEHIRMLAGLSEDLPPILVHRATLRVVDGMHRLRAARLRGSRTIEVEFFEGGEDDVFALSVRLNIAHGLPLSREDRMAAARRLLDSRPYWSNRRIAATAGLSASTISSLRRSTGQDGQLTARVGRDGRVRPVRASDGRLRASQVIIADPHASLRNIAERAGIATATAKDVRDRLRRGEDPIPPGLRAAEGAPPDPPSAAQAPTTPGGPTGSGAVPAGPEEAEDGGPPPVTGAVLTGMHSDPSLRTDAGRLLLRLLAAHSLGDDAKWRHLARGVPGHRREMLAHAARRCADHWLRFAEDLDARRP